MSTNQSAISTSTECSSFIQQVHNVVNTRLQQILSMQHTPCPILKQALEYTALSSGKKLRAALILSLDDNFEHNALLVDSACAIELIHTYSLIHDDLPAMDDDDIRRGQPSCHKKFNEATAILAGDSLQSLAFELISGHSIESKKALKIVNVLAQAIGHMGMVGGQSLELNQKNIKSLSVDIIRNKNKTKLELLDQIHLLKTAKLFTGCLHIAAISSSIDTPVAVLKDIIKLGEKLGLAFQIQDDLLDYKGSTKQIGKPSGSDAKRGLNTYSNIIGQEHAPSILANLWGDCDLIINQLKLNNTNLAHVLNIVKTRAY